MLPLDAGLFGMPEVRMSTQDADRFGHGQTISHKAPEGRVRVYLGPRFLGVGESDGKTIRPKRVIAQVTPRSG